MVKGQERAEIFKELFTVNKYWVHKKASSSNPIFSLVFLDAHTASWSLQEPTAHPLLKMSFISSCYCLVVSPEGGACCRGQCQQIKNNAQLPGDPCVFLGLLLILLMKILIFMNPPKIHTYLTTLGATSCIFISEVPSVPSLGKIQFLSLYHLTSFRR